LSLAEVHAGEHPLVKSEELQARKRAAIEELGHGLGGRGALQLFRRRTEYWLFV